VLSHLPSKQPTSPSRLSRVVVNQWTSDSDVSRPQIGGVHSFSTPGFVRHTERSSRHWGHADEEEAFAPSKRAACCERGVHNPEVETKSSEEPRKAPSPFPESSHAGALQPLPPGDDVFGSIRALSSFIAFVLGRLCLISTSLRQTLGGVDAMQSVVKKATLIGEPS